MSGMSVALAGSGTGAGGGGGLSVSATPPSSDAGGSPSASSPYYTPSVTIIVAGGSGSYTYAWSTVVGGHGFTIDSPAAASTLFSFTTVVAGGLPTEALARCDVTDTVTLETAFCEVPVSYTKEDFS